jgi:uncharacterized phage protein (TIGR01671 family)
MIEIEKRIRKYRAWNKENKTMDYDGGFLFDLTDFNIEQYKYLCLNTFINKITEELEVMQFIGRHDTKGKEIYEADIIKWNIPLAEDVNAVRNDYIHGLVMWDIEECKFMVLQLTKGKLIYKKGEYTSEDDIEFYSLDGAEFNWDDIEVIGNLYENPDLYSKNAE